MPPYFHNVAGSSDSEISGRYSPVCSENDTSEVPTATIATVEMDATQVAFDELAVDDDDTANDDQPFEELKGKFTVPPTCEAITYVCCNQFLFETGK